MLEKPSDGREVVCNPSAWDFGDQKDFRLEGVSVKTRKLKAVWDLKFYFSCWKSLCVKVWAVFDDKLSS